MSKQYYDVYLVLISVKIFVEFFLTINKSQVRKISLLILFRVIMMEMQFLDYMKAKQLQSKGKDKLIVEQMKHLQLESDMKDTLRNVSFFY